MDLHVTIGGHQHSWKVTTFTGITSAGAREAKTPASARASEQHSARLVPVEAMRTSPIPHYGCVAEELERRRAARDSESLCEK
jgi:hypothetical protein